MCIITRYISAPFALIYGTLGSKGSLLLSGGQKGFLLVSNNQTIIRILNGCDLSMKKHFMTF